MARGELRARDLSGKVTELIESLDFCLERGFLIESIIALRISERPPAFEDKTC
jgi:hypothetical protein